jgi:tripartite-type tricarboxylate transporter receptor subunit TctC
MIEAGLPDFDVVLWASLFAPAGTPRAIVERVQQGVVKAMQLPDVRERMLGLGITPVGNTPEELAAIVRADLDKWTRVIRQAGVKAE